MILVGTQVQLQVKMAVMVFILSVPRVCMDQTTLPLQAAQCKKQMTIYRRGFYPHSPFQTQMVRYHLLCSARKV